MPPKPDIKFWNMSFTKWNEGIEKLKANKFTTPKDLKAWFDDLIQEKCGFCDCYIKCDKCPAFYSLICHRVQDNKLLLWQIWDCCWKGNKELATKKTEEFLSKIQSLKDMFEEK